MAVIQISKIQIRRGAIGDQSLPQLASGEMGWAIDTQQLFIGSGSVSEGAPAVDNVEILTRRSLFDAVATITSGSYIYKGFNDNVIIDNTVQRTVQQKLDEQVTAYDFGAAEQTDITSSLQNALDELYLNSNKQLPSSRVPLRLPAGTYFISSPVYVPPFATITGDGIDKTVLVNISTNSNTTIFATIDGTSTPLNRVRGLDILSSSQPRNIKISGMTLAHTATHSVSTSSVLVMVDGVSDSEFSRLKLKGVYLHYGQANINHTGFEIIGNLTNQCVIEDCVIEDLCYPITSNYDATDIQIEDNLFKDLYQGITFATDLIGESPKQYGPRRVNIEGNKFVNIERQAIYAGENTGFNNQINSENNSYINVGNGVNVNGGVRGDDTPVTPIITMLSHGNSSVNDNFERLWYAQIAGILKKQRPAVEGTAQVDIRFTDRRTLAVRPEPTTFIRVPYGYTATNVTIEYTLFKNDLARTGTLNVVAAPIGLINLRDNYALAGDGALDDVVFNAVFLDTEFVGEVDTVAVQYVNPVSTCTCVFNVSYYR